MHVCTQGGDAGGLGLGGGGEKDALLLLGLFTLVLVGSLAQDLAGDTWEKVQKEVKDETALREANPEAYAEASDGSDGFASLLPFNATAVTQGALNLVPKVRIHVAYACVGGAHWEVKIMQTSFTGKPHASTTMHRCVSFWFSPSRVLLFVEQAPSSCLPISCKFLLYSYSLCVCVTGSARGVFRGMAEPQSVC